MNDIQKLRAELAAAERAEYERRTDQVAAMRYQELVSAAATSGYRPGYDECDHCPSWGLCWHREADRRSREIDRAREARQPGYINLWNMSLSTLPAADLAPGDFLRTNNPLPGVKGFGGYVEVLTVSREAQGAVLVTVRRTNDPDATPVTHHYPPQTWVDLVRPLRPRTSLSGRATQ